MFNSKSIINKPKLNSTIFSKLKAVPFLFLSFLVFTPQLYSQVQNQQQLYAQNQQNRGNNSGAFRQEIARFDISVVREGKNSLPISQVPRVQYGDIIKVKMLDEVVGGIKPDQSLYNWTFLVAFVNPNRNKTDANSVSQEIVFRKSGWYQEYSFKVPFDSQPLFFLYPKPNYRDKILKLLNKNYEEVQKLGEKTIEIAGAYAQIGMFLNELQGVLSNNYYGYNTYQRNGSNNSYIPNNTYNSSYNNYGYNNYNQTYNQPTTQSGFNFNLLMAQSVERLARSFNIQLPNNCWQNNNNNPYNNNNNNNSGYNNYGNYNNNYGYNNNNNNYGGNYGNYNNYNNNNNFGYGINQDLIGRVQCIAKNVRIEDFDQILAFASLLIAFIIIGLLIFNYLRNQPNKIEEVKQQSPPNSNLSVSTPETNVNAKINTNIALPNANQATKNTNVAPTPSPEVKPNEPEFATLVLPKYLKDLQTKTDNLRGNNDEKTEKLRTISPNGKIIRESSPVLTWESLPNLDTYKVTIFDEYDHRVAKIESVKGNSWRVPNLPKGKIYHWQVFAKSVSANGTEQRFLGAGKFYIVAQADENKINQAKDSLQRGKAYAEAGLLSESIIEFRKYLKENPNSETAKKFLRQVEQAQR